jgi:hypothetical protein
LVFPHRPVHVTVSVFYGATVNIIREEDTLNDFLRNNELNFKF